MSGEDQAQGAPAPDEDTGGPGTDDGAPLNEQLDEAVRERDQFRAMAQRDRAELINYRKRTDEQMRESRSNATAAVLLRSLTVVDDLERALAMIPDDAVAPGWRDGLELVLRNLNGLLESEGVSKIEAVGRPFDPWEFEAVLHEETADAEEGEIVRVMRDGYRRRDKVLRAAQVVVAKSPQSGDETDTDEEESE